MGWSLRASRATNRASRATEAASRPSVVADSQQAGCLDDRVGQHAERGDRQHRAGQVETAGPRRARRRDQPVSRDQGDRDDRQVDQEDRVPAEVGQQPAARHRADRDAEAADRGPQADGLGALGGVGEHGGDDRQGGRHDERAADAHERPSGDEHAGGARQRRGQRADTEHREAKGQALVAAEAVGERPGREQQPGEHQDVAAHHPLQRGDRQVQAALDGRDRNVDHVVVEVGHEGGERHRHQDPPASGHRPSPPHVLYVVLIRRSYTLYITMPPCPVRRIVVKS